MSPLIEREFKTNLGTTIEFKGNVPKAVIKAAKKIKQGHLPADDWHKNKGVLEKWTDSASDANEKLKRAALTDDLSGLADLNNITNPDIYFPSPTGKTRKIKPNAKGTGLSTQGKTPEWEHLLED